MLNKLIAILCLFSVCFACNAAALNIEQYAPDGAYNIKKTILKIHHGEVRPATRTMFKLNRAYPDLSVISEYEKILQPNSWKLCNRVSGIMNKTLWEDLITEKTNGKYVATRQLFRYFVNYSEKKIISIRLYYDGKKSDGDETKWNLSIQNIEATYYDFQSERFNEIMTMYSNIGLNCSK